VPVDHADPIIHLPADDVVLRPVDVLAELDRLLAVPEDPLHVVGQDQRRLPVALGDVLPDGAAEGVAVLLAISNCLRAVAQHRVSLISFRITDTA
jgi:hypothetical protein